MLEGFGPCLALRYDEAGGNIDDDPLGAELEHAELLFRPVDDSGSAEVIEHGDLGGGE